MQKQLIIIGAGAHARAVLEAVQLQDEYIVKGFCVDTISIGEKIFNDYTVLADALLSNLQIDFDVFFIVAIGDNNARNYFFENALKKFKPATIIHSLASCSPSSSIGQGSVVFANVYISSSTSVAANSIINIGTIVDHDCLIGANVHLSIGTVVGSNSTIADGYTSTIGERINSFSKIL